MKKNKNKKNKNKKKKRTPAPPGNVRPNSFVPRAPKGTHAGEGSLASTKCHCLLGVQWYAVTDIRISVVRSYGYRDFNGTR